MRMVYNHCEMFHSAMVSFGSIIARILSALPAGHISDACMNGWRSEKNLLPWQWFCCNLSKLFLRKCIFLHLTFNV